MKEPESIKKVLTKDIDFGAKISEEITKEKTVIEMTPEEAVKILNQKAQKDIKECSEEIARILEKYGCFLDVSMIIRPEKIIPQVQILKKQQQ